MLTGSDFAAIRDTAVVLLDNSWVEKDGLVLDGLSSGYMKNTIPDEKGSTIIDPPIKRKKASPENSVPSPDTAWLAIFAKVEVYKILLCHHPEYISMIPPTVNLVLSGWFSVKSIFRSERGDGLTDEAPAPKGEDTRTSPAPASKRSSQFRRDNHQNPRRYSCQFSSVSTIAQMTAATASFASTVFV